jgi:hypothetical protein
LHDQNWSSQKLISSQSHKEKRERTAKKNPAKNEIATTTTNLTKDIHLHLSQSSGGNSRPEVSLKNDHREDLETVKE